MLIPMTRLQIYVAGSAFFANIVLLRAYYERPNFYSAAVYISQSTGSLLFLINLGLIVTASIGYGLQRVFYGPLRVIETEQLYDKAWFAVSETLLAMTIFRDDIGVWFFAMFLLLLAGKVWQWIGEGRVELLEQQPPANPRLFHARLVTSLVISVIFDVLMGQYCVDAILQQKRRGVMVMFGFEYVLLTIASLSTLMRYALSLVELVVIHRQEKARDEARRTAREAQQQATAQGEVAAPPAEDEDDDDDDGDVPGWEEKGRWVFSLDLTTDFIKSIVYVGFFIILVAFYGIPIHIMRDLFMTLRSFVKRLNDFRQYRNATRDMNARYPDATVEELARENTCIVCREEMRPWVEPGEGGAQPRRRMDERQRPKKLPCGHILHFSCLRSWLERQQFCPTCRRPVLSAPVPENRQNNQMNQNQQDPLNAQNAQGVRGLEGIQNLREQLRNQLRGAQAGQPGPLAPQGNQHGNPPVPPNRPAGNLRVYNFGPIRIALGRLPIPQNGNNANNNGIADLAQQVAQDQGHAPPQGQTQVHGQLENLFTNLNIPPWHTPQGPVALNALPQYTSDIQSDILRIQQNIIDAVRQLNHQHAQLEYIHALLAELNRLQQASGIMAGDGQELPTIAPLNPAFAYTPIVPQAYAPNGPVLRRGDAGLPEGVVLPENWTLRPMTLAPQPGAVQPSLGAQPTSASSGDEGRGVPPVAADPTPSFPPPSSQNQGEPSTQRPTSPGAPSGSSVADSTTSKQAEGSSLESSWSFGNAAGANEAEGSSSAVARSGSEGQSATRRAVTVEDAEDNGE